MIAGNGTIGLEILEDLPDVDAVLVPYGGGGLSLRHRLGRARAPARRRASRLRGRDRRAARRRRCAAGAPRAIDYTPSFVDGIGGRSVLAEMWPLARALLAGSLVVSLAEIAAAVRLLAERNRVVAEGAGAASVAAALEGERRGKVVCVVSGGNIDAAKLSAILAGRLPTEPPKSEE